MSEELMPDKNGRFGIYGGRYVAETLVPALEELSDQYELIKKIINLLKNLEVILLIMLAGLLHYILQKDGQNCLVGQRSILSVKISIILAHTK